MASFPISLKRLGNCLIKYYTTKSIKKILYTFGVLKFYFYIFFASYKN